MKIIALLIICCTWLLFSQSCMRMRTSESEANKAFKEKKLAITFNSIVANGSTIHYAKVGTDALPTLFFVHGSPGSWDAFKRYMMDAELLQHFRIIAIDRPGFGYSNFGKAMHLQEQSKSIIEIVKKEDNKQPVHLIGHSIGGPVVVQLAQDYPSFFSTLTVLSGSISPYEEPTENWRYVFNWFPLQLLLPGAFKPSNTEIIYFKKDLFELDKHYNNLTLPITFIHGNKDPLVSVKNVQYGVEKLSHNKQVKQIIIDGANHFIPWQHFNIIQQQLLTYKP